MKRWAQSEMQTLGLQLFQKLHKRKHDANHNIHFLAREITQWLPQGIQSLIAGTYTPQHLQRYYFKGEMLEQLTITDRIYQHLLLKQLKPTFKHIVNQNCFHCMGPLECNMQLIKFAKRYEPVNTLMLFVPILLGIMHRFNIIN